jgi:hypothetical protein
MKDDRLFYVHGGAPCVTGCAYSYQIVLHAYETRCAPITCKEPTHIMLQTARPLSRLESFHVEDSLKMAQSILYIYLKFYNKFLHR